MEVLEHVTGVIESDILITVNKAKPEAEITMCCMPICSPANGGYLKHS